MMYPHTVTIYSKAKGDASRYERRILKGVRMEFASGGMRIDQGSTVLRSFALYIPYPLKAPKAHDVVVFGEQPETQEPKRLEGAQVVSSVSPCYLGASIHHWEVF